MAQAEDWIQKALDINAQLIQSQQELNQWKEHFPHFDPATARDLLDTVVTNEGNLKAQLAQAQADRQTAIEQLERTVAAGIELRADYDRMHRMKTEAEHQHAQVTAERDEWHGKFLAKFLDYNKQGVELAQLTQQLAQVTEEMQAATEEVIEYANTSTPSGKPDEPTLHESIKRMKSAHRQQLAQVMAELNAAHELNQLNGVALTELTQQLAQVTESLGKQETINKAYRDAMQSAADGHDSFTQEVADALDGRRREKGGYKYALPGEIYDLKQQFAQVTNELQHAQEMRKDFELKFVNAVATAANQSQQLASIRKGNCLKCNMGPLRESCAYPEACEHPGRELALKLNQTLLDVAFIRRETLGEVLTKMKQCKGTEHSSFYEVQEWLEQERGNGLG